MASADKVVARAATEAEAMGCDPEIYPESLFNCDMLLPDTTIFFQLAI